MPASELHAAVLAAVADVGELGMNELILEALRLLLIDLNWSSSDLKDRADPLLVSIDAMLAVIRQDREAREMPAVQILVARKLIDDVVISGECHLGVHLGDNHPAFTASVGEAHDFYGDDDVQFDMWLCWRAIMLLARATRQEAAIGQDQETQPGEVWNVSRETGAEK